MVSQKLPLRVGAPADSAPLVNCQGASSRGPVRTDHIFYKLFQAFPDTLFELLGVEQVSRPGSYSFDSVEVKETALRIDGVFVPTLPGQPHYFAEVQFQKDRDIYWRLFTEVLLYLRESAPQGDWRAVLIFPGPAQDTEVPAALSSLAADERFVRVYLDEVAFEEDSPLGVSLVGLVVEEIGTFPGRATRLIKRTREQLPAGEVRRRALEFIETIIVYKLQYGPEEVRAMFTMDELEQTPYVQGLMAEARREAKRETLLQLLHQKFGSLDSELVQRITAVQDEHQLSQLAITVLNAPDLESFCAQL